jgi:hypothetical protein
MDDLYELGYQAGVENLAPVPPPGTDGIVTRAGRMEYLAGWVVGREWARFTAEGPPISAPPESAEDRNEAELRGSGG